MSETADVELIAAAVNRGRFPIRIIANGRVLFAGQVNPHNAGEIETFVSGALAVASSLSAEWLRDELLQLAAPRVLGAERDDNGALYEEAESCLWWNKPTKDGVTPVRLTNFSRKGTHDLAKRPTAAICKCVGMDAEAL